MCCIEKKKNHRDFKHSIRQLDNHLKQVGLSLKKGHEQEKAKREQVFKGLDNICYQCGQTGHVKSECISQPLSRKPQERSHGPMRDDVLDKFDHIKCIRIHSVGRETVVPVNVDSIESSGVIDTGADVRNSHFVMFCKGCQN